jgi:uncharacterized protein
VRKARVVRDPVHGYLTVAAHETIIIDHPITQRLRRITQTGLAELVFPEARTSRLVHSFGAMHLASQFLMSCIENADEADALAFLTDIDSLKLIDSFLVTDQDVDKFLHVSTYAGSGLLSGRIVFRTAKLSSSELHFKALLAIIEAALRLAALFHDLGHLPFSHDFEFALRDYIGRHLKQTSDPLQALRSGLPPHEAIGHKLAKIVLLTLVNDADPTNVERAAFGLAVKILDHEERYDEVPSPNVSALGWLHSLIDGEIDVDRADYLLRDGRALGLEFADYDLPRLVSNIKLSRHPDLGYITAVREQGLTAVEGFYLSRSRSSQVLVRHHKVAQIGIALRHATTEALGRSSAASFLDALRSLKTAEGDLGKGRDALRSFAVIDDPWWIQVLKDIEPDGSDPVLSASLKLALWREPTFHSIWKRKGDLSDPQQSSLNALAKKAVEEFSEFEEARTRLLGDKQTLIALHRFRPYGIQAGQERTKSVALIATARGDLVPAAELSPLMRALYTSWDREIHLHAFCLRDKLVTAEEVIRYFQ